MQAFVPTVLRPDSELCGVPLEILVDFRCESGDYERLVPQTDAEFSYDKFNRLRLHNEFSNASRQSIETNSSDEHMRNQTVGTTLHSILDPLLVKYLFAGPYHCQDPPIHRYCELEQFPGPQQHYHTSYSLLRP